MRLWRGERPGQPKVGAGRVLDAAGRRARRQYARLSARRGAGLILLYHRIAEPPSDPWQLAVTPRTFERHLRLLSSQCRVLTLSEMFEAARRGRIPDRAVAITFDDGYVDNLEEGLPLLEKYGTPATIYIATGYVDSPGRFWWDELQDLIAGAGPRPDSMEMALGGIRIAAPTATERERRHTLLSVVHPVLRASSPRMIQLALERIREWAGGETGTGGIDGDPSRRPMTREELERLSQSPLIELGPHTSTHPSMVALTADVGRDEVESSQRYLEELTGSPPAGFSYPFGDNNPAARRAARACGFQYAVGVRWDTPVTAAARRFELPRLMAIEESEAALQARMEATLRFRGDPP
ncbi:MAG TPA: polysaccharide deacetylase family protein [Solirubrobacterales bacterium]